METPAVEISSYPEIRLNAAQLRVLAHPLRARLLSALRIESPQTATTLAEKLGTNTGATSYHLRQLAVARLVVEDGRQGTGRERWWRAAHSSHGWVDSDVADDPDGQAAADWLQGYYLRNLSDRAEKWLAERRRWSAEWLDAASLSDFLVRLTPAQLSALNEEITELIRRYQELPEDPAAEPVLCYVYTFPRIGKT